MFPPLFRRLPGRRARALRCLAPHHRVAWGKCSGCFPSQAALTTYTLATRYKVIYTNINFFLYNNNNGFPTLDLWRLLPPLPTHDTAHHASGRTSSKPYHLCEVGSHMQMDGARRTHGSSTPGRQLRVRGY